MTVKYLAPLKAPVKKGDIAGSLKIEIPDQQPIEMNLLAGEDVERKGLFGRVKDRVGYLLMGTY